jgi:predicted  nucleic acid-binding Zn-ribbon protein
MSSKSNSTSRKTTARQYEMQLKAALKELQAAKALTEQLLQERDDSEAELQKILAKNTAYKAELAQYDLELCNANEQVKHLQEQVDSFNQCASTHEVALKRIANLEKELGEANYELDLFRRERERYDASILQNLYQELVCSDKNDSNKPIFFSSNNKLKKYVKINRYIRRTQKLIKSKACYKNYSKLVFELSVMKNRVQQCTLELDNSELNTQKLQVEINRLQDKLESMSSLYASSQRECKEHIQAFTKLLEESNENEQRFNSLINNYTCDCRHTEQTAIVQQDMTLKSHDDKQSSIDKQAPRQETNSRTIIYSDQIGSGMGSILNTKLEQNVTNYCYRNASLTQICDSLLKEHFDNSTSLILLIGNSASADKASIDKLMLTLNIIEKAGIGKIIICALPYSQSMSYYQNNKTSYLNSLIYHSICFNNKYHFLDLNKFIKRFTLAQDQILLPKKDFLTLVDLLAFNIEPNRYYSLIYSPQQVSNVKKLSTDPNLNWTIRQWKNPRV